jgi:hypothetical protein
MYNSNVLNIAGANQETLNFLSDFYSKAEKLTRILSKESEFFREMKIKRAEQLLEAKTNLIEDLKDLKEKIVIQKDNLKNLPESEKSKIRAMEKNLTEIAEINYNEALKAREVNLLIMEAIAGAVSNTAQENSAYTNAGGFRDFSKPDSTAYAFIETV